MLWQAVSDIHKYQTNLPVHSDDVCTRQEMILNFWTTSIMLLGVANHYHKLVVSLTTIVVGQKPSKFSLVSKFLNFQKTLKYHKHYIQAHTGTVQLRSGTV